MAHSSYVADLANALDQTIADLERQAGGIAAPYAAPPSPRARGSGGESTRSTGAPAPSAPPPAPVPVPVPVPVPAAPPQQEEGAASAPPAGAYSGAPATVPPPFPFPEAPYAPAPAAPAPDVIDGHLSTQIRRLEELRRWVRDDPAFGRLVDSMIGRQVQAAEKRQRIYTAAFSVVSLAVGWLLPVLVPVTSLTKLLSLLHL
jgi:hypothetical protein